MPARNFKNLLFSLLLIYVGGAGMTSCAHKCPAQTGGYVAPPPKVGKHHKPQTGLWGSGMKRRKKR